MFFASAATFGDGLETFNFSLEGGRLPFCVVGSRIEGTMQKMNILRVADRSVAIFDGPWCKTFVKDAKSCDFRVVCRFFTNSEGGPVGPGPKI